MSELINPVIFSVLILAVLSLARVNVIVSLIIAALVGGLVGGLSITETTAALIDGLGGQGEAALSYILLGTLAAMVSRSGLSTKLIRWLLPKLKSRRALLLFVLAGISSMSQTVVPVHIAFIPILIPPLLTVFNKMKIDRRAIATALTFGLKAPWLVVPLGFGLIFQGIVVDEMAANGMDISIGQVPLALAIPAASMVIGLSIAIFFTYRRERTYHDVPSNAPGVITDLEDETRLRWGRNDLIICIALLVTLVLQIAMLASACVTTP
jgi:hypothetical protein